jgi:cholest-4-en-3-one 26-monooxygenase
MDYREIDKALSDPGFFVDHDPHPMWRQLRKEDPVHWTEPGTVRGYWSVTRYDDIIAVVSAPALFTSAQLFALPSTPEMEQITPEMLGSGEMLLMTDPPLHVAMRRAFNRLLLPRAVGKYEVPDVQLVREILDEALARGECDFVIDVAARLPMAFICEIMGIPRADWPDMFKWGNMIAGYDDAEYQVESGSPVDTRQQGTLNMGKYCIQAALERRGAAGEDLLSVLGNARINGRPLTERELAQCHMPLLSCWGKGTTTGLRRTRAQPNVMTVGRDLLTCVARRLAVLLLKQLQLRSSEGRHEPGARILLPPTFINV